MNSLRLVLKDKFGNIRTLSSSAVIDAAQPTNTDNVIWIDTTYNPPILKYLEGEEYKALVNRGCSEVFNLSKISTDKTFFVVELNSTSDTSLSVDGTMVAGQEIRIIVHNGLTTSKTLTIPNGNGYVNLGSTTIELAAGKYVEINLISDGKNIYIRNL